MGISWVVHTDQGHNFENTILKPSMNAFEISKSCNAAYHPEGQYMVERLDHTLLQVLCAYVAQESQWEEHLPLVLYVHCKEFHIYS